VDSTILIEGESGVGKELIAQELHNTSLRQDKHLLKSTAELYQRLCWNLNYSDTKPERFTGARKEGKIGIFELANGGTLFLDEIAELPVSLQVKTTAGIAGWTDNSDWRCTSHNR
jgi:transcriptional regulator with PAS, ATPase and Fis domain